MCIVLTERASRQEDTVKVIISKKIQELQKNSSGIDVLREIITTAKFNEPQTFKIPGSNREVVAKFIPTKGKS